MIMHAYTFYQLRRHRVTGDRIFLYIYLDT